MPEYFTGTVCLKSVTRNWMSSVPEVFSTLPFSTMPPRRKRSSAGGISRGEIGRGIVVEHHVALETPAVPSHAAALTPATMPATMSMRLLARRH